MQYRSISQCDSPNFWITRIDGTSKPKFRNFTRECRIHCQPAQFLVKVSSMIEQPRRSVNLVRINFHADLSDVLISPFNDSITIDASNTFWRETKFEQNSRGIRPHMNCRANFILHVRLLENRDMMFFAKGSCNG